MSRVVLKIRGAMGNQIAQLLFGLSFIRKTDELVLDISYYEPENYPFHINDYYPFILADFTDISVVKQESPFIRLIKRKRIYYFSNWMSNFINSVPTYFTDRNIRNRNDIDSNLIYLDGYWQSVFMDFDRLILNSPQLLFRFSSEEMADTCAMHFRLGDYIDNPVYKEKYKELDVNYYRNALERIVMSFEVKTIIIFSDRIDRAKLIVNELQRIYKNIKFEFSEAQTALRDFESILKCQHIVTANSSYSLQAATMKLLSKSTNKGMVVSPSEWFNPGFEKVINAHPAIIRL